METPPTLPFQAWEQAVFVAIFVVFALAFVGGTYRAVVKLVEEFKETVQIFQATVVTMNDKFSERNTAVVEALQDLTLQLKVHDEKFDEAMLRMARAAEAAKTDAARSGKRPPGRPRKDA